MILVNLVAPLYGSRRMPGREYISFQLKTLLFIFSRHTATHSRSSETQFPKKAEFLSTQTTQNQQQKRK